MVRRDDLEKWLDEFLSVRTIQDYLPNGLQIEGAEDIHKVVTAVSFNLEVVEAAVREKAQALLVHHGLFWKNEDPVIRRYRRKRIGSVLENNVNLFAYHLPLDMHPEISHNRLILEGLGASRIEPAEEASKYGLLGLFDPPVARGELQSRVESSLNTQCGIFPDGPDQIRRVFVVSGGGKNELDDALSLGIDTFLTGDAKEATPYAARESGINYLYAGHYATERPGVIALGERIAQAFDVEIQFVDVDNPL
jgi:dinuclear metal center YbgI/SA1388 family protein